MTILARACHGRARARLRFIGDIASFANQQHWRIHSRGENGARRLRNQIRASVTRQFDSANTRSPETHDVARLLRRCCARVQMTRRGYAQGNAVTLKIGLLKLRPLVSWRDDAAYRRPSSDFESRGHRSSTVGVKTCTVLRFAPCASAAAHHRHHRRPPREQEDLSPSRVLATTTNRSSVLPADNTLRLHVRAPWLRSCRIKRQK